MPTDEPLNLIPFEAGTLRALDRPVRVVGIDLGTTNSTLTEITWDPDHRGAPHARTLEIEQPTLEGSYVGPLVPSVVAIDSARVWVGEGAKRLRALAPFRHLERNRSVFYECKNDMGLRRTYHRAPEGFRSAAAIGGRVIRAMVDAALEQDPTPIDRVVVTVPASFQLAQRSDTAEAMTLAGLTVGSGDLLDEPTAAFVDYAVQHPDRIRGDADGLRNLVVLDFGGGTCDVVVLEVRPAGGRFDVAPRTVSRYHRLGGGDIDRAIVHSCLIPQLLEQNELGRYELSYEQKKLVVEPALLGVAENLKEGLCADIRRLEAFGKYQQERPRLERTYPGSWPILVGDRELQLGSPKLAATAFEKILEPFLEPDLLYPRETEYLSSCSIFAPLQDALDRAGIDPAEVGLCLLVGGSSLIPQVRATVGGHFPNASVLSFDDRDAVKTCVSRGAAFHALALAAAGRGVIQPVTPEDIAIRTRRGVVPLIARGTPLPFPADGGWASNDDLQIPETATSSLTVRFELVGGEDHRTLAVNTARFDTPVFAGDPLALRYRVDGNQVLTMRARLADADESGEVEFTIENPLTNVVNPSDSRRRIDEIEEELRTTNPTKDETLKRFDELARLHADIGHPERALAFINKTLRARSRPDAGLLNRAGILCGEIGDHQRQEKYYREAAQVSTWSAPLFNLALAYEKQGRADDAVATLGEALERSRDAPYLVLKARLARAAGDETAAADLVEEALGLFDPVEDLEDYELYWIEVAARMARNGQLVAEATAERQQRQRAGDTTTGSAGGVLPDSRDDRLATTEDSR